MAQLGRWWAALAVMAAGCVGVPGPPEMTTSGESGSSTGGSDETGTIGFSSSPSDGGSTDPSTGSAGTTDGESSTGSAETGGGPLHPECSMPAPRPLPPEPFVNVLPDGSAPAFTEWEALGCDDPSVAAIDVCTPDGCAGSQVCLHGGAAQGVCTSFDVDIWCDGEGEVAGYGDGCFMCMSAAHHARACCELPESWDCRPWPFEGTSGPSMVCATHDDCQTGLVCASPIGFDETGYGVCRCPEDVGGPSDLGDQCY